MSASIYKASAGAGKTYLLVQHYIAFCLQPNHRFDQALAITFTNKAATEMKSRILDTLQELATGKANAKYVGELQTIMAKKPNYTPLSAAEIQYQAKLTRSAILHRYGQFAVGTIDKFFQRILRSFARELKLSVNYNLELDEKAILTEVTDLLLERLDEDQELANWLLSFMRERLQDGKNWNVETDLVKFSQQLLSADFRQFSGKQDNLRDTVQQLKEDLQKLIDAFENEMDKMGEHGLAIIKQHGLTVDLFFGGKSGICNHFNKIKKHKKEYAPTKTLLKSLAEDGKHRTRNSAQAAALDAAWANGVRSALEEAVNYYETHKKNYRSAVITIQHLNQLGILSDMSALLKQIRDERDLLLISDTNYLLASLTQETDTPFIYEKVGQQYRFFLLDEFQDTSTQQWANLLPLLSHALSEGNEVLVVGDIKQSIYRWRGGNMQLLKDDVVDAFSYTEGYSNNAIVTNWRSLPAIVAFNNALFTALPDYLPPAIKENDKDNLFNQLFEDAQQEVKRADALTGYVQFDLVPFDAADDDDESWQQKHLQLLLPVIDEVLADGYQGKDICFLVDTNKDGALLAQFLSENDKTVISQDSLLLGNSRSVSLLIHTLQWMQQPNEKLWQVQLMHTYRQLHSEANNNIPFLGDISAIDAPLEQGMPLPPALLDNRKALLQLPLYDLIEYLIQCYSLDASPDAFISQFQDVVLGYVQQEEATLPAFLTWWAEKGHMEALSTTASADAMQIMTIHKSKGLEFPVVFIPFLRFNYKPRVSPLLWVDTPTVAPYPSDIRLPVVYTTQGADTYFEQVFIQEGLDATVDQLNKWYVAFTRAGDRLYVWGNKPDRKLDSATLFESILTSQAALGEGTFQQHWQEDRQRLVFGQKGAVNTSEEDEKPKAVTMVTVAERQPWQAAATLATQVQSISAYETQQNNEALALGQLLHELLARIDQLTDIPFEIQQMVLEGWCSSSTAVELEAYANKLLIDNVLQSWFAGDWQALREHDILLPGGTIKRPDRVIVKGNEARVLDYKTGQPNPAHDAQVQEYADLLQQMGYTVSAASIYYTTTGTCKSLIVS